MKNIPRYTSSLKGFRFSVTYLRALPMRKEDDKNRGKLQWTSAAS